MSTPDIPHDGIRAALAAILASPGFRASPRMRQLLSYVVEARLSGQQRLKAWTVSTEVFGGPTDALDRGEGLVRRSMARLRERLAAYYADEGQAAPVRIVLRSGCYLPEFRFATRPQPLADAGWPARLLLVEPPRVLGGDAELELLALGLTEELIASLSGYADAFTAVHAPVADGVPPPPTETDPQAPRDPALSRR